jgi:hypothetical protein
MIRPFPLVLALFASFIPARAQNDPCDPRALLPTTDPAYADAVKLSETLNRNGIQVRCVLLSKESQMFDGQLGAAFFRTEIGDFEALFLAQGHTWDNLKILQIRDAAGYVKYQFRGSPAHPGAWEGKPVYFVKHGNEFLHSLDSQLVSKLRQALKEN